MLVRVLVIVVYMMAVLTVSLCGNGSMECPVWFEPREFDNVPHCLCSPSIEGYIACAQKEKTSFLHLGMAVGYNQTRNNETAFVAYIPYIYPRKIVSSKTLDINLNSQTLKEAKEYLCGSLNRTQNMSDYLFCGRCDGDYGPAIYSYGIQCVKCSWWALLQYVALQTFPITVFYLLVLIFKIDLTRPNMFHYIIFCNVVTTIFRYNSGLIMNYLYSNGVLPSFLMKIALTMSGVWCLDFLRFVVPPFCVSPRVHDCLIPFFDFFPALHLIFTTLVIVGLIKLHSYNIKPIHWLWRPFHQLLIYCKLDQDPTEAVTHTYATFFFLYFIKTLVMAIVTALTSTALSQKPRHYEKRNTVFYDPTTTFFDPKHISVFMTVFVIAAVLIIPAVVLLLVFHTSFFQCFYRAKISRRWQKILQIFVQTLQNGYKDGTQGTRDWRPMVGGLMLSSIISCTVVMILLRNLKYSLDIPWPSVCLFMTMLAVTFGTLRPYKKRSANNVAVVLYGVLIVLANLICFITQRSQYIYHNQRRAILIFIIFLINVVNFVYLFYITYKIASYFGICECVVRLKNSIWQRYRCPCDVINREEEQRLIAE